MDTDLIKKEYISAARFHASASANGNYQIANKQAKKLRKIYREFEQNKLDKTILLDLLEGSDDRVKLWAAAHLLGLKYATDKAEESLRNIQVTAGRTKEENLIIFSAKKTLENWEAHGLLKF